MLFGKSRFTIIFMSTLVLNISLPKRTSIYSFTIWTKTMKSYIEFSTYTMYNIHSWKHPHKGNKRFSNHRWQNLLLNELCYFVLFLKNRRKVSHKKLWQDLTCMFESYVQLRGWVKNPKILALIPEDCFNLWKVGQGIPVISMAGG